MLTLLACVMGLSLTSCHAVWEDEPECPRGLSIRFVYDYNMEYANAFMSQVHCLTVFVYDQDGNLVKTVTETDRNNLSDENWRMNIDLPEGTYRVYAYGGMACDDASFEFEGNLDDNFDRRVMLKPSMLTSPAGTNLHPLFFGELRQPGSADYPDLPVVGYNDSDYQKITVYMMKDTNNVRIIMNNVDNSPIYADDFKITLRDNNTLFNYDNSLLDTPEVTYWPWSKGEVNASRSDAFDVRAGEDEDAAADEDEDAPLLPSFAFAELSTSRFVTDSNAILEIEEISTGRKVLSIPLVQYLLRYKGENIANMRNQEFLDRKSEWELSMFLERRTEGWYTVQIKIENWTVRVNDASEDRNP